MINNVDLFNNEINQTRIFVFAYIFYPRSIVMVGML